MSKNRRLRYKNSREQLTNAVGKRRLVQLVRGQVVKTRPVSASVMLNTIEPEPFCPSVALKALTSRLEAWRAMMTGEAAAKLLSMATMVTALAKKCILICSGD